MNSEWKSEVEKWIIAAEKSGLKNEKHKSWENDHVKWNSQVSGWLFKDLFWMKLNSK